MQKKVLFVILYFIVFVSPVIATAQQFSLGNVSKAELEEKIHPVDTAAPAAILYERGKTYYKYTPYGWYTVTETERRIKIYKKAGYDYAEQQLTFYKGDAAFNVFSDACTYNLDGDKIVKTKVGDENEFVTPKGAYSESRKIFFPSVKEGSIIEFKYIKTKRWRGYMPDWYFQEDIFMNSSEYSVAIPAYFTHHSIISGDIKINSSPQIVARGEGFQENRVTYSATNIPPVVYEPYSGNPDNYRASVKHELVAYTNFAAEETRFATSWKSLVLSFFENEAFGKQLEIKNYFRKDVDPLLKEGMTADEKINVIFNYVQDRMEWNEYGGYSCDLGVKEAYSQKKGNTADINLMLTAMLQYAGLSATPVLLATRDRIVPVYPSMETFNYVVCGVQSGANFILLDATSKYTVPGMIQPMAVNGVGRKIKPDGSAIEVDLIPKQSAKSVYNIFANLEADGSVSGKIRNQYFDYKALMVKDEDLFSKQDEYIVSLEKKFNGAEITDYVLKNEAKKPVMEEYSFSHKGLANVLGEKIIISPMLFFAESGNPFTADKRQYPIDFVVSYQNKYMITLNLPKDYTVESFPEPASVAIGDNVANFKYNIDVKKHQLQLIVVFEINQPVIEKENYTALKNFFGRAVEKQQQKIILKKA